MAAVESPVAVSVDRSRMVLAGTEPPRGDVEDGLARMQGRRLEDTTTTRPDTGLPRRANGAATGFVLDSLSVLSAPCRTTVNGASPLEGERAYAPLRTHARHPPRCRGRQEPGPR